MNIKTFNLIDKINATGLDNSQWNIYMHLEKTDTKSFYGTSESFMLPPGMWVSVYERKDEEFPFREICKPDHTLDHGDNEVVLFYSVD